MSKQQAVASRRATGLVMGLSITETDRLSEDEFTALVSAWNALQAGLAGPVMPVAEEG